MTMKNADGVVPAKEFVEVLERWHNEKVTDRFYYYRRLIQGAISDDSTFSKQCSDGFEPLEFYIMFNVVAFISRINSEVHAFDHIDTVMYLSTAWKIFERMGGFNTKFKKGSEEYNIIKSLPSAIRYDSPNSFETNRRPTVRAALEVMDYLESDEFANLLTKRFRKQLFIK